MMWSTRLVGIAALLAVTLISTELSAESDEAPPKEPKLHHQSHLQIRAAPVGTSLVSDTAWRVPLWPDRESIWFEGTRLDAGVTTSLSPAYLWGGPYLEVLPVSVLELRVSVQAMGYWGTFGHLYTPPQSRPQVPGVWDDESLERAWKEGRGRAAAGWKLQAGATPRLLVDRLVATAGIDYRRISMGVDAPYYEPFVDLLLHPVEHLWNIEPTVGYLFGEDLEESHLLAGLRWQRVMATRTGVSRDVVGVVWDWGIPDEILDWGQPRISGFGGATIGHPTRSLVYPYLSARATVEF